MRMQLYRRWKFFSRGVKYSFHIFLEYCFDSGYVYTGSDIGTAVVKSTYLCQKKCQQTSGCKFFTYNFATNICSLKSRYSTKKKSYTSVSGPAICYDGKLLKISIIEF